MPGSLSRRDFVQLSLGGGALYLGGGLGSGTRAAAGSATAAGRASGARIARLYLGTPHGHWPTPKMDLHAEIRRYEEAFAKFGKEFADVDFAPDALVTSVDEARKLRSVLAQADGILAIHLSISIMPVLAEILAAGKPTMFFAAPYSGHEWADLGALERRPEGAKLSCILTSDLSQLASAVRPLRAIHYLKAAKILNLSTLRVGDYAAAVKRKFGTTIVPVSLEHVLDLYHGVDDKLAAAEAETWIKGATEIKEPPKAEIVNSCRLALAFDKLLADEQATALGVDCYGSMYQPLCKSYAFPCVGLTRLNDKGLVGTCESDLQSSMTQLLFRGLTGRAGFISDPTMDESCNGIILAHCLGTRKMDGPDGPAAPYKLRTIMERQEGVVPQVTMRIGEKATQAKLVGDDLLLFFTGAIIDAPDTERGCRTKITVKIDGDATKLWKNWSSGLHRVTCYGNIKTELAHFCRLKGIKMVDEAV
jgi:hypothetical protein